jgi:sugar lactone lactonase YvrE
MTLFTGCGRSPEAVSDAGGGLIQLSGIVHGGQQPVSGAAVQLYAAGRGGNATGATAKLTTAVTTDSNGFFSLTGDYTCTNANDQMYLVGSGGNPGLAAGTNNAALVMMAALGPCSGLSAGTYTYMNERTTAAAAWALGQFMTSPANLAASSTNYSTGLTNAFLDAQLLANTTNGAVATLPSNLAVESGKLNALADALSTCVNSAGTSACTPLFTAATPSGGTTPTNTLTAALNIVKNPGNNVSGVWNSISGSPPFPTTLTAAPHDWTMSLTVTGGGLVEPTALDVDAQGNVWVADYPGYLSAFTPQGTPFRSYAYGNGTLNNSFGLTIDTSGNVWVSNEEQPSHGDGTRGAVSMFLGSNSGNPGAFQFYIDDNTVNTPLGLAADTNGDILIANASSSMASIYFYPGGYPPTLVATGYGASQGFFSEAVTADANHGLWLADEGDGSAVHVGSDGTVLSHTSCCAGADAIVVDSQGNAWVSDPYSGTVAEVSSSGSLVQLVDNGGVSSPSGLAIDASQDLWVTNVSGNSIAELAGVLSSSPGAGISPSTGYGLDANLASPHGIVADASGNLWIANYSNSDLVMLFGLAKPTATPVGPVALAP